MQVNFWLHAGSTYSGGTITNVFAANANANRAAGAGSIFSSTDNTLEITGIQLEVGSQATPFEHRSFGEELKLCQRYYIKDTTEYKVFTDHATDSGSRAANFFFPTTMRAQPSMTANPNAGSVTYSSRTTGGVGYTVGGSVNNSTKLNDGYVADAEL
jgi:hypothetical protein